MCTFDSVASCRCDRKARFECIKRLLNLIARKAYQFCGRDHNALFTGESTIIDVVAPGCLNQLATICYVRGNFPYRARRTFRRFNARKTHFSALGDGRKLKLASKYKKKTHFYQQHYQQRTRTLIKGYCQLWRKCAWKSRSFAAGRFGFGGMEK